MRLIDADKLIQNICNTADLGGWIGDTLLQIKKLAIKYIHSTPSIDICFCRECIYYDPPHVEDNGKRIEYKDLPEEAFDELGTGLVNVSYGVNIGGRCCVDYNCGYAEDKRVYRAEDNFCGKGRKALYSSEKPNNCEHITEDGVTCAKYPACDDCPDNSLNKLKGSERLVKGKDEPTISKMEQVDKDINVRSKDEPQTETETVREIIHKMIDNTDLAEDAYPGIRQRLHDAVDEYEPQTERSE